MDMGKLLVIFGAVIILAGIFMSYGPSIPFLGKLPGDIYFKRDNFSFYFPITTSILASILLTFLFRIFSK
ncbi:DUF2905 domain-containing protein [Candidatus Roizmanbacteria bacterium]|nr:MAG: DUF2905 domain-containing protein [Candidatus Roizmanbacteria bacterium]